MGAFWDDDDDDEACVSVADDDETCVATADDEDATCTDPPPCEDCTSISGSVWANADSIPSGRPDTGWMNSGKFKRALLTSLGTWYLTVWEVIFQVSDA